MIVSPTRELARQIHTVLQPFAASVPGITTMLLTGGS
jgi:superfamily II DNA/RNA helicase